MAEQHGQADRGQDGQPEGGEDAPEERTKNHAVALEAAQSLLRVGQTALKMPSECSFTTRKPERGSDPLPQAFSWGRLGLVCL
ncbi:hypothetical protein FEZ61_05230 [Pseudomonas sp. MS15a(2019)]|nr:hypothetical protein [Pseudomonas sp. MS15a(2019)]